MTKPAKTLRVDRQALEDLLAEARVEILPDGRRVFYVQSPIETLPRPDETKCPVCGHKSKQSKP